MDLRVNRTLKSIKTAFIDEVLTVGFEKVTVLRLATLAQINPKTFYDHFHDKYDLADYVAQQLVDDYTAVLDARLAETTGQTLDIQLTPQLTGVVAALLKQTDLQRAWRALTQVHFDGFDLRQRLLTVMQARLKQAGITDDALALAVIPACAYETLNYYVQTGEPFSPTRQRELVTLLSHILAN